MQTKSLAAGLALAALAQGGAAVAQPYGPPIAPPQGQYAPPPPGAEARGAIYDPRAQAYDRDYAQRYSEWAAQYCENRQRSNNTAAGAVIGGVLGAVIGSNVAGRHDRGAGAVAGGALGAVAGAAIGNNASTNPGSCPPGYVVRPGAPAFAYGPGYSTAVVVGPSWYNPWFWSGDRWVYRPYRYWYWNNRTYWRPDYHPGRWQYRYHRW